MRGARALFCFALLLGAVGVAFAQAPANVARVGYLGTGLSSGAHLHSAFVKGLSDLGYVEGRNLVIERRTTEGRDEQYPVLAGDLVRAKVDVIFAPNTLAARAARQASSTLPVVFSVVADPVGEKLIVSLQRPGGNATGITIISSELVAKRLDLLVQAFPKASRVGVLYASVSPALTVQLTEAKRAASGLGKQLMLEEVVRAEDIERSIENLRGQRIEALMVSESTLFFRHRKRIAELVTKAGWPAMYGSKDYAEAGGLISYGPNYADSFRRAASHVAKILKGAKPGDLPVEQPTVFELSVNLKAAKAAGIKVPQSITGRADHVIE